MFEVGVRQAWDLPLLNLAESTTSLPFDVQSRDTVFYSLKSKTECIESIEQLQTRAQRLLRNIAATQPGQVLVVSEIFGNAMHALSQRRTLDLLLVAKRNALQLLCAQMRGISDAVHVDLEKGRSGNPLEHHVGSVQCVSHDLRAKVNVIENMINTHSPNAAQRQLCDPIVTNIKRLQKDIDNVIRQLQCGRSSRAAFAKAEKLMGVVIENSEHIIDSLRS